ncbi:hypothetical protein SAMN06265377_1290 [Flagellimonas pacifica]|uniref:Uncharacterized protein n=1 Tax=Flagellimonas pacifica TaxID=1247520 RepID=A0A285MS24_9FLAO|nr:hypothetical protein SAMN06265377_1290 [Allomuricauda parva]
MITFKTKQINSSLFQINKIVIVNQPEYDDL